VPEEWIEQGLAWPQSRGSQIAGLAVGAQPGERVLDLCAAPGGKTTHLAALTEGRGALVAVERHPGRAEALRRTADRMGVTVDVRTADAAAYTDPEPFDRVLVDPPCSDLGTLASRPDARWRKAAGLPEELARLQLAILRAGGRATRPGGALVYSTCTISPAENEGVVRAFLAEEPDFAVTRSPSDGPLWEDPRVPGFSQTLPHRDGTEGFFVARLHRRGPA
jgi:16S rRNA (cytosine967-C5)-methyltransferase